MKIRRSQVALMVMVFVRSAFCQQMISPKVVHTLQMNQQSFTLVDVRSKNEFELKHIPGAVNIPKDSIKEGKLPKNQLIALYCGSVRCPLSHETAKLLMGMGYSNVNVLYGGIVQWEEEGYPVEGMEASHRGQAAMPSPDISVQELAALLRGNGPIFLLDLRQGREFIAGHLPDARNIRFEDLPGRLKSLPASGTIVVYDRLSARSRNAVQLLAQSGLAARALSGGVSAWSMSGHPLAVGSQDVATK